MTIEQIYLGAENLINQLVREEFQAQGHSLTGAFELSLDGEVTKTRYTATLAVYGLTYGMTVNTGLSPDKISWKMLPGLTEYFIKRGVADAKGAATATIKKWMTEGMSTQASKRFSQTGGRQHFVEAALLNSSIDEYMDNLFEFGIDEKFNKVKNETI